MGLLQLVFHSWVSI